MNSDKKIIIDGLLEKINASPFLIVIDYTAITVPEFTQLRVALDAAGANCMVAKNTFMVKALAEAGLPDISEALVGQTAFVLGNEDVCAAAKAINEFAKKNKKAAYKVGILDGAKLDAAALVTLGNLPSRDALLSQLLSVINGAGSALARVIKAYADKEAEATEVDAPETTETTEAPAPEAVAAPSAE